jgi:hypothetical protein
MRRVLLLAAALAAAAVAVPRPAHGGCRTYGVGVDGREVTVLARSAADARALRVCR